MFIAEETGSLPVSSFFATRSNFIQHFSGMVWTEAALPVPSVYNLYRKWLEKSRVELNI
jgi:hypothetical protein